MNYSILIKLPNPSLGNFDVMFNALYIINYNEWNIFPYSIRYKIFLFKPMW